MNAKDKAYRLAMRFDNEGETDNAVRCAILACNEIQSELKEGERFEYWQEVKEELWKL